ncbi:MAG: hypothetical protein WEB09_03865 [Nitriliruptor sp.]
MNLLSATAVTLLALVFVPSAASAQTVVCAERADVSWSTDHDLMTVTGASVAVPGCPDGTEVGLQLITDDGDLPAQPLVAQTDDERAEFDLTPLGIGIEPVTGVRVLIHGENSGNGPGPTLVEIVVEHRYFNAGGNEQRGLRDTEELTLLIGAQYEVFPAGQGYETTDCEDLGIDTSGDVAAGVGIFEVTGGGRHLVCHQRTTGGPVTPPVDQPGTDVLDEVIDRDGPTTGGDSSGGDSPGGSDPHGGDAAGGGSAGGGPGGGTAVLGESVRRAVLDVLPRTGGELLNAFLAGVALVVLGAPAVLTRRRRGSDSPRR